MNIVRYYFTMTHFANQTKILAAGGEHNGYEQTAEIYDMVNGRWAYTPMNMTAPRFSHGAVLLKK